MHIHAQCKAEQSKVMQCIASQSTDSLSSFFEHIFCVPSSSEAMLEQYLERQRVQNHSWSSPFERQAAQKHCASMFF